MSNNEKILVALDDGSGNMAYAFDENGTLKVGYTPSLVEAGAGVSVTGMSSSVWRVESGKTYTVKKSAEKPQDTCYPDYQTSEENRVLAINTLSDAGLGGKGITLGCTLPTTQYYTGNPNQPVDMKLIEAKKQSLMQTVTNVYGVKESPVINKVVVFPEAIPAYFYVAHNSDGSRKDEYMADVKTAIIDLGRFTNDLAIIADDFEVIRYQTTENGVHKLISDFHSELIANADRLNMTANIVKTMNPQAVEMIFRQGFVGSTANTEAAIAARIDVSDLVNSCTDKFASSVYADLTTILHGDFATLSRLIFVGGGAHYLRDIAQNWHPVVDIPEHPETAIVNGVYLMLSAEE